VSSICHAQKEWSNWFNSGNSLLTFTNGYAEHVTDFIKPVPPPTDYFKLLFPE